jgi:CRP-like cAMP-binding protein
MKTQVRSRITPVERRKDVLDGIRALSALPSALLTELAAGLHEEHFPLGAVIVAEGELSDRLFIVVEGQAEVSTAGSCVAVSLATLEHGDVFGEVVLGSPSRAHVTVAAVTPLATMSLSSATFKQALLACPDARRRVEALAESLADEKFLKQQLGWSV